LQSIFGAETGIPSGDAQGTDPSCVVSTLESFDQYTDHLKEADNSPHSDDVDTKVYNAPAAPRAPTLRPQPEVNTPEQEEVKTDRSRRQRQHRAPLRKKKTKSSKKGGGGRRHANAQKVLDSVADSDAKYQAIIDVYEDALKVDFDDLYPLVDVNQYNCGTPFQKRIIIGSKNPRTPLILSGTVKVAGELRQLKCYSKFWDHSTPIVVSSDCGLIVWCETQGRGIGDSIVRYTPTCTNARIHLCVESVLEKQSLDKPLQYPQMALQATAVYLRRFPRYTGLERDISNAIHSDWFGRKLNLRYTAFAANWEVNTVQRLQHMYMKRGKTFSVEYARVKKNRMTYLNLKNYAHFILFVLSAAMIRDLPGVLVAVTFIHLFTRQMIGYDFPAFRYKQSKDLHGYTLHRCVLVDMLRDTPSLFTLTPCSLPYLRKSAYPLERLPPIVSAGAAVHIEYIDKPRPEEKVDIFGTTIPGPMTYPMSGSPELHGAISERMVSSSLALQEAGDDFYHFAIRMLEQMPNFEYEQPSQEQMRTHLISSYGTKRGEALLAMRDERLGDDDKEASIFVKGEVYIGKTADNFKPRQIWASSPRVIAHYSYFFSKMSKWLTRLWDGSDHVFYTNCSTPDATGAFVEHMFNTFSNVSESDVSNWDGSISKCMLDVEEWFLRNKVIDSPDLEWLHSRWSDVRGSNRNRDVRVRLRHGRRSGDLWTSSFNSILNVLITMYVYDLDWEDDWAMMVLGDDNIVALPHPTVLSHAVRTYSDLGMKCEIIARQTPFEVTYCSGRFWRVGGAFRWGNLPFRMLMKLGMNHHNHHPALFRSLLYGTCLGLIPTAGHIPVIGSLLRAIADSAEEDGITARFDHRHDNPYRIQGGNSMRPDMETYAQFAALYDMDIHTIICLEEYIECCVRIEDCPYLLEDEIFIDGLARDIGKDCGIASYTIDSGDAEIPVFMKDPLGEGVREEEIWKLGSGTSIFEALSRATQLGDYEDSIYGTTTHWWLHQIFTLVSWISLPWGIGLHQAYNRRALVTGRPFAGRNRRRGPRRRKKKKGRGGGRSVTDRAIGAALRGGGGYLGNMLAPGIGGVIGTAAGGVVSQILGFGDYSVSSNTLQHAPMFGKGSRSIRIRHREYVTDIIGSTTFSVAAYAINPGSKTLFPWLSGIAQSYQQYRIHGMVFYFNSTSADALNSTNTALGTVIMATNYDVNEPPYTGKPEMQAAYFSNAFKPSEDGIHAVECDPHERPIDVMYIDHLGEGDDESIVYDHGLFQLATQGMQAAANIGQLWVSYDLELLKPRYSDLVQANSMYVAKTWDATDVLGTTDIVVSGPPITYTQLGVIGLSSWRGKQIGVIVTWTGQTLVSTGAASVLGPDVASLGVHDNASISQHACSGLTLLQVTRYLTVGTDYSLIPTLTVSNGYTSGTTEFVDIVIQEIDNIVTTTP